MTNFNVNLQDYLQHLVNEAVQNSIPKTVQATAELLKQDLPKNNPDDLLTPKEASDILKCSITTLWRYEQSGKVNSLTIGGKRLYKRSDLFNALNK
ncbi:hypothetical protein APS56_04110 [Pseudalgibacter alginicilyticus]|uniref:Helix-turn-helix domain-containing protein n=1 Tax=Pseudalgibacter alginicilyticus TaxID=1736674 RepID=A0A0P0D9C3_9FLAO|nr:helix-turn-helix domain-containing protein [Pseudalgibacter alginicilyticus]ALJ04371.1 hypothetical protein APS56_04110 [Pseudalgibacter alginicilyticus]